MDILALVSLTRLQSQDYRYTDSRSIELGHTIRGCKEEAEEAVRVIVKCVNCDEGQSLPEFFSYEALMRIQSVIALVIVRRSGRVNLPVGIAEVTIFPWVEAFVH